MYRPITGIISSDIKCYKLNRCGWYQNVNSLGSRIKIQATKVRRLNITNVYFFWIGLPLYYGPIKHINALKNRMLNI